MRGAPVGVLEGYGARRLGGCGRRGSPATGHPVRDRERRGRARRRAMAPAVRGAAPPLVGHGLEGWRISSLALLVHSCCFARGEAESGMEREERGRGI